MSGKLRGQRAKAMKFNQGLMIHSGDPVKKYVATATRHVLLRQGVLGIKVCFMIYFDYLFMKHSVGEYNSINLTVLNMEKYSQSF